MRRREFLGGLGSAAAAWPTFARAQQAVRRIALLLGFAEDEPLGQARLAAFRQGLQALGWVEGRNIRIDTRWAGSNLELMTAYAAEVVASAPDAIVVNSTPFIRAVQRSTQTIPVLFVLTIDPVGEGFIASMARPGGNITGFSFFEASLIGKWMDLLKQVAPALNRSALIFNPETTSYYLPYLREAEAMPGKYPLRLIPAPMRAATELEGWIESFARVGGGSLISPAGPFGIINGRLIAQLAERLHLPAVSLYSQFVKDGGLMSYGADSIDIFRRSATYVDRILKGERPADLPAQAPTKYELAINLKTAKALGLTVPPKLLFTADEVIE
jgi:putative ABC transport system substrate-binding protein